ncbi:MAG: restriction endonuclease [Ignavibacteriales bacterium]|nr:restriction endonuclease [Ignavibacteriales bacterium]
MKSYRVGHSYRDLTKRVPEDEFINWLDTNGSTIGTTGGIRPKKFLSSMLLQSLGGLKVPSSLVITTTNISQQFHNPWEDVVDYNSGSIIYWGDAKFDPNDRERTHLNFSGNKILNQIHLLNLQQKRHLLPPILHFSRNQKGWVLFNGLCVLDRLETTWFEDKGRPIINFRCHLSILDIKEVPLEWLHQRALADATEKMDQNCPIVWRQYLQGHTNKLFVWMGKIRTRDDQLPPQDSDEARILEQICSLSPVQFERFCRRLFQEMANHTGLQHHIRETRHVRDGGFDFFGRFIIPEPLNYEIEFKGEAKKYHQGNGVGPKEVSRLVARLQRGEYGIFVTTSYYTQDAQKEVREDQYPVRLFSGMDLVNFLKALGKIVDGKKINSVWLDALDENQSPISDD